MTSLTLYQVDAFTDQTFGGNPAAVCALDTWLPDDLMQKIAMENNLSETVFFAPEGDHFHIRWFTPTNEVKLCGHATLATAHVLFKELEYKNDIITFNSKSGHLHVHKAPNGMMMDFPVWQSKKSNIPPNAEKAFGKSPIEYYEGYNHIAIFENASDIQNATIDFSELCKIKSPHGYLISAPGNNDNDFVSRCFFPNDGVPEDPVTGSAHCSLTPIWAEKLNKTKLHARQISARGGDLMCELKNDRVEITGQAVLYMKGEIYI